MTNNIYNLSKGQVKICSKILNKSIISYNDFIKVKNLINYHLHTENLSPREINEIYNLGYKDFGCSIKYQFNIKLKSLKEAQINTVIKNKSIITDEKKLYWKKCKFTFDPYIENTIIGFHLLTDYSFSTPQNKEPNKIYLHRDHMVSISYGWENNIPPEHISHPANCEILIETDNISKSSGCSITYETLLERIKNWNNYSNLKELKKEIIKLPMTENHKHNISISVKKWHKENPTNRIDANSLTEMEKLLNLYGIDTASKLLNLSKKQFKDKLRYRRKKFNS